jgi:hypothetical protein
MGTPTVPVLADGAATTCLTDATGTAGAPTEASYTNLGTTARTVLVTVSTTSSSTTGAFDLLATVAGVPYTESTLPAACDDLSSGTLIEPTDGWSDDSATDLAALPFTVQLYGAAMGYYSVTSNGYAQLWASSTGSPSTGYSNEALPSTDAPRNMIAPFWDDLIPAGPGTVSVATFGTTPTRHFTVQWTDWSPISDDTNRLTFQIKLFETTNVIEFHYCTMTPADDARVTGDSATVGLQNGTGTLATQHSYDTATSVGTTNALRFTPAP